MLTFALDDSLIKYIKIISLSKLRKKMVTQFLKHTAYPVLNINSLTFIIYSD